MLPCWSVPGKFASAWLSEASCWLIACANVLPLVTRLARSSRRSAIALTARAPFTTKSVNAFWSRLISDITSAKLCSDGPRYLKLWPRLLLWPAYQAANPWSTP